MSDLVLGVTVGGAAQAVSDLQRVGQATTQTAGASRAAADQTAAFGSSAREVAQHVQGMAGQVAALASRLGGGAVGQAAGLVGSLAGVVTQSIQMGAAMGPGGAVVGALTGLVPLAMAAADAAMDLARGHNRAAEAADRQAVAERSLATAVQRAQQARADARESADVTEGVFGTDTSDADLQRLSEEQRQHLTAAQSTLARIQENGGASSRLEQMMVARVESQIQTWTDALHNVEGEIQRRSEESATGSSLGGVVTPITPPTDNGHRARAPVDTLGGVRDQIASGLASDLAEAHGQFTEDADARAAAYEGELAALDALEEKRESDRRSIVETKDTQLAAITETKSAQQELLSVAEEAADSFQNGFVGSVDAVIDSYRRWQSAAKRAGTEVQQSSQLMARGMTAAGNQIVSTIGRDMQGALQSSVAAWLDGSKTFVEAAEAMAKGVLKSLVTEAIVQGVVELARGIADIAGQRYDSGALHFAAAAAWAAVGVVAGGVGAAVGAFGGGGDAKGNSASTRDTANASREREAQGGGNVTLYVYPGGYITKKDVTAGMIDALNEGARSGMQLDPRIVRRTA